MQHCASKITVYNLFGCGSIESLSQLHNSNLVTSVAEPSGELKLSGRPMNDVLPTLWEGRVGTRDASSVL